MERYRQQLGKQPAFMIPSTKRAEAKRTIVSGKQDPVQQFIKTQEEARVAKREKKALQIESEIRVKEFAETEGRRTRGISEVSAEIKKLGEHKAKIKEYEKEGFDVEKKEGELVFTKPAVYETRKEQPTVVVFWRRVGESQTRYQSGAWEHKEMFIKSIEAVGGTVVDVKYSPTRYVKVKIQEPQEIRGTGYVIHPSYGAWEEMVQLASKLEAKREYRETGEVPTTITTQIDTPSEFATIGLTKQYQKEIYEYGLGLDTQVQTRQQLETILGKRLEKIPEAEAVAWAKTHAKFGEKTWEQVKADEPALELIRTKEGEFTTTMDYMKWLKEEYAKEDPLVLPFRKITSALFAGLFNPTFWSKTIQQGGGAGDVEIAKWEYGTLTSARKGDIPGTIWKGYVTAPIMTNVVLPYAAGSLIKPVLGAISTYGTEVIGGFTGKVVSKALPVYFAATIPVLVGADVGYTFAMEHKGQLPVGTAWGKAGQYGLQFTMFGLGAKYTPLTQQHVFSAVHKARALPTEVMTRTPGLKGLAAEIDTFKVTGKYGYMQRAGEPRPSDIYLRVESRIEGAKGIFDTYISKHQFLKQEALAQKYVFESPISMEQKARFRMFEAQTDVLGIPRAKPRMGYALPYTQMERLTPEGGWLVKAPPETLPVMEIVGDQYFTRAIPTEEPGKGMLLEYELPHAKIHTHPKITDEFGVLERPYEYDVMRGGKGVIFKPDMPGIYTIRGKKVFIGQREAWDIFAARRTTFREYGGAAEPIGRTTPVLSEGKLYIPKKIAKLTTVQSTVPIDKSIEFPHKLYHYAMEKVPAQIPNIEHKWYKFVTFTKDDIPLQTVITPGIGRTEKLFDIAGVFKGHKMEVSKYYTYGEYTRIQDPIVDIDTGKFLPSKPLMYGAVKGRGYIYDLTDWYGSSASGTKLPSKVTTFLTQVKQHSLVSVTVSQKVAASMKIPSAKQLPLPETGISGVSARQVSTTASIGKITPTVIPLSITIKKTTTLPATRMKSIERTTTRNIEKQINKVINRSIIKQMIKPVTRVEERSLLESLVRPVLKPMEKQVQRSLIKPLQKPMVKPIAKQAIKPIVKPITPQITKLATEPILELPPVKIVKITEIITPPPFLPLDIGSFEPKIFKVEGIGKRKKGARKRMHPIELLYQDVYGVKMKYEI